MRITAKYLESKGWVKLKDWPRSKCWHLEYGMVASFPCVIVTDFGGACSFQKERDKLART